MKVYSSRGLGLPLARNVTIVVEGCIASIDDPQHYWEGSPNPYMAHTHICPYDKNRGTICLWNEDVIKNKDGSVSQALWHEYAHVLDLDNLDTFLNGSIKIDCSTGVVHAYTFLIDCKESSRLSDFLRTSGHGESWKKIMRHLNQEPTLWVNPPS